MSGIEPLSFLQSVAGFAQANQPGFAPEKIRLATIDPAYVSSTYPGTLPKVTFDGETALSGKRYPVMSPYLPTPGDRVVMVPLGATYLIIGPTDQDASVYIGGDLKLAGDLTVGDDLVMGDDLTLGSGSIITWAGDTNLYRWVANLLRTDDSLYVGTNLEVFGDVTIGDDVALTSASVLTWAADTTLYRSAADTLKTDDSFEVAGVYRMLGQQVRVLTYENEAVLASGQLLTGTSPVDVTGVTLTFSTLKANAICYAEIILDVETDISSAGPAVGRLNIDGADQTDAQAIFNGGNTTAGTRSTVSNRKRIVLASAGSHTIKMRANSGTASQGHTLLASHTRLNVQVFE